MSTTLENIAASLEKESKIEQDKVKGQYDAQLKLVNSLIALEEKYAGKEKFSEEELKEIQKVTCYGSLGYCCGLQKKCFQRDVVRDILKISDENYKTKGFWINSVLPVVKSNNCKKH